MADTFVDLTLDRSMIDPMFEGYKLSLDKIPVYQHTLESAVDVKKLRDDQYSYQHMKAFGTQNHLFPDPYADAMYIIDERRKVVKICLPKDSSTLVSESVLAIPSPVANRSSSDVTSPSVHFPSAEWAVVADGEGSYHVVQTKNRSEDNNWEIKYSSTLDHEGTPFLVNHSIFHQPQNIPTIQAVFLTVTKAEEKEEKEAKAEEMKDAKKEKDEQPMETEAVEQEPKAPVTKSAFVTTLHWITLIQDGKTWQVSRTRKLAGAASPDYVTLEEDAEAIIFSSEKPIKFSYDSEKPVEAEKKPEKWVVVEGGGAQGTSDPPTLYTWSQTMQDVSVTFTLPPGVEKVDILYKLSHDKLEVGIKNGQKLLCGHLHASVDPEGSTWTMDADTRRLTVELSKSQEDLWPVIVLGDTRGEMTFNPSVVEEIHQRLAHLTSEQWNAEPSDPDSAPPFNAQQLEDCDIFPDENSVLARIDGETHLPTHQVNIGGHQHLFTAQVGPVPAFCLRHDVDGILWQPCKPTQSTVAPFKHRATFNALGFVAASKQDRKFSVCSPDTSVVALVDCFRRVYVYRAPEPVTTPVRNRKTGVTLSSVAKQHLVTLEDEAGESGAGSILGAQATDRFIVVLKEKTVFVVKTVREE